MEAFSHVLLQAYLDRAAINQQAVQLLEGGAGAVRLVEGDVGNSTALRVGAVDDVDPLDGSDGLDEVFL